MYTVSVFNFSYNAVKQSGYILSFGYICLECLKKGYDFASLKFTESLYAQIYYNFEKDKI